ncbi:MAG: thioredoxin family protein [Erysipelotrichaceae bacterium]|nr:thioredoxin family protein [Erysipelotrichaceae bacterium]
MSLFGSGKKKEEVKVEPACACNGKAAAHEASSCCCENQQEENVCDKDNKITSIKVLGAGCKSCHKQFENVKKAVEELGLEIEVEYITDMEKVMAFGVMSMPAIVVNEKVVSMGKVLKSVEVIKLLGKLEF